MNPELRKHLEAALKAATEAGDVDTVHSIASILKKAGSAAPDAQQAPVEPVAAADIQPTEPTAPLEPPTEVDPMPGVLYTAAQTQLEAAYPGHEFEDETPDGVVISCPAEDGTLMFWQVPVTVDAAGVATLGTAVEVQPPADEPIAASSPDDQKKPGVNMQGVGIQRFFAPIDKIVLSETTNTAWVNIINLGEYEHPQYGSIEFTAAQFAQWKKNFHAGVFGGLGADGKPRVAADYGHSMDSDVNPETQKASGYMLDLKLEGNKVYALVEFTPAAADAIRKKEFAWWSISEFADVMDKKSGENVGAALGGGALTNRPYIPGLEPIQLSDLRPATKTLELKRQLEQQTAEIAKLKREAHEGRIVANMKALQDAGVPPAVLQRVRPILNADDVAAPVKLSGGHTATPGALVVQTLLEMARLGAIPLGEKTSHSTDVLTLTQDQAIELVKAKLEKEGKKDTRYKDLVLMARADYPHLKG